MGREIKRVPLDFQWPLNKVWGGFLMPDELRLPRCEACNGQGWSTGALWLRSILHTLGMAAGHAAEKSRGRIRRGDGPMHPYLMQYPQAPRRELTRPVTEAEQTMAKAQVERIERETGQAAPRVLQLLAEAYPHHVGTEVIEPTPDLADLYAGLAETTVDRLDSIGGSSHEYTAMKRIVALAGLPEDWTHCPVCNGSGEIGTEEQKAAEEAWESTEPPEGPGWQLWETVSEGSPISPVFPDDEGLINWLCTEYSWGAQRQPMTRDQAETFVREVGGWAPSLIYTPERGLQDGATALADDAIAKREG